MPKNNELGVTILADTNKRLERIKKVTGLSKGMLANIGLAFLSNEILAGRMVVVNGEIRRSEKAAA